MILLSVVPSSAVPTAVTLNFFPFRCHSRFCPTCGIKYSMERTTSVSFKLVNVQHRHCIFTIDENLRDFFLINRSLLDCLFLSFTSVVSRMFFKMNMAKNFTPGFIMILHTFDRDLKWNPHIHCLISEGGHSDDGFSRSVHHFNYTYLRNSFRTALLNELEHKLGSSFKKIKAQCYTNHKEGFYVYAKPNKCDPKTVIKYIGRYLGRPVIATSRIDGYDGEMVTFHYNRHEDNNYVEETIPAIDFIKRLIRHIPEKHFKMIRLNAQTANMKCCFWNFTMIITVSHLKKFTRKQCPKLVENCLLHNFYGFCDRIL